MTKKSFIKTIGEKGLLADYNTEGKKLQTELTFDTTPTAGSTNPVTSDGIKKAIDVVYTDINNLNQSVDEVINSGSFATKEYVDSMLGNVEQLLSEL